MIGFGSDKKNAFPLVTFPRARLFGILSTHKKFWFRNVPHHFQIGLFLAVESLTTFTSCGVFIVPLRKLYILNFHWSSFLYHRSCKMLFYIPVSQTVEVRRATFCLIWILTFPESPRSTLWKLFPGQSAAFISICHSILTFSLLAHFSNPFPVICENRKPFPVLTKSLSCAWSNFCGRHLSHLRLASCRLVLPLKVSCYQVKMDHEAYDFFSNSVIFHP